MKKFIVIAVMVGIMAMAFTACGSDEKSHTGHLMGREPVKTDMFDGSLLHIK